MADYWYYLIMLLGIFISSISQLILKKGAIKNYSSIIWQYVNIYTFIGYGMMFVSTLCSLIAHRVVPVSYAPVWNSCSFILVTLVSRIFLKEIPTKQKLHGLSIMVVGIIVFSV